MNYRGATAGGFRRLARAIVACAVLCVGICMLAGCTSYPSVEDALKDADLQPTVSSGATLEPGVLTVGVNASNAPYAWPVTVGQTTVLDGIDVDVAVAMAERMGLTVKFVDVASDYEAAAKGLCDVVMGASTMTLPGSEVLVGNYLETAPSIFAKNATSIVTVEQLGTSTVGVQSDSLSARTVAAMVPTAVLSPFGTLNDAFSALEAGSVQYVACDSFMGGYLATGFSDTAFAGTLSLPETRGVAVAASNVELQNAVTDAVDQVTSSGELQAIREVWVGSMPVIGVNNLITPPAAPEPAPEAPAEGEVPVEGAPVE